MHSKKAEIALGLLIPLEDKNSLRLIGQGGRHVWEPLLHYLKKETNT